jgi:glycosyltransferase involved in cell wall biosynthesis
MKKILFIQNSLPEYRVPLFLVLAANFKLTLCTSIDSHINPSLLDHDQVNIIRYKRKAFFGFYFVLHNKPLNYNYYDHIIVEGNARYLYLVRLFFSKTRKKTILFGPWLSSNRIVNLIYFIYVKTFAHTIVYCRSHFNEFVRSGMPNRKLTIANNTVSVLSTFLDEKINAVSKHFIVVGTLDRRKSIHSVIQAYLLYTKLSEKDPFPLYIIGDGPDYERLINLVTEYSLSNHVKFLGRVTMQDQLKTLFMEAVACISFSQAGLSVLQSFGYATPFICHKNALSGGELSNIIHEHNGYLVESILQMSKILLDLSDNNLLRATLQKNSLCYYQKSASFDDFCGKFIKVLQD